MPARTEIKTAPAGPSRLLFWLLLLGVIWLAAFLRLHQLDQTPPGLYHDEAFYAVDAQHLLNDGHLEIFYTGNNGREPLHIYLLAGAMWLLGERAWTTRLVSAVSGILAIPLIYCLGRALWRETGRRARWVGLLAAAGLATSYWAVSFSRIAFRAMDLVTLSTLAVWLLWRGVHRQSRRLLVFSGIALGVNLYTYLSARVLPVVFLGLAVALVLLAWRFGHGPLRTAAQLHVALRQPLVVGSLVALAVATAVFIPLGAYFAAHPQEFIQRSSGLSVFSAGPAAPGAPNPTLAGNILATVRMFIDRGDAQARHNLPYRPALDWVGQIGLLAGLAGALLHFQRPRSVLLLLWLGLMLLPTTLSIEAPHFLRAIGALPPLTLLVAGGLGSLGQRLGASVNSGHLQGRSIRQPKPGSSWLTTADASPLLSWRTPMSVAGWPALLIGVTLVSFTLTYRDYFLRWAPAPETADVFDTGTYTLAQRALAMSQTEDVLVPLGLYTQPTALFVLEPVFGRLMAMDGANSGGGDGRGTILLAPPQDDLGNLVLLRRTPGQPARALVLQPLDVYAAARLSQLPASDHVYDAFGRVLADERSSADSSPFMAAQAQRALDAVFDNTLRLSGADLRPAVPAPGSLLQLDLYWNSLRWVPEDEVVFVQLQSTTGENLAQRDSEPVQGAFPTTLWLPGTFVTDHYTLTVPSNLQPGKYRVIAGLYQPGTVRRLPVAGTHDIVGDTVALGVVTLADPQFDLSAISNPTKIAFGDPARLYLIGHELATSKLAPGSDLTLDLYWQALRAMDVDYTVFVHVLDASGQVRAQADAPPLDGRAPTSWWQPGDVLRDPHTVHLGADLPPGTYTLSIGLYYYVTGERLPIVDAAGQRAPDDQLSLGTIQVQAP